MSKSKEDIMERASSLLYDDMEDSGLLNDVIVTFKDPKFVRTNYGGRSTMYRPAAHIILEEESGTVYDDQFWSCGSDAEWTPSDCGKFILPTPNTTKTVVGKTTNFGILMRSLMENGFPKDKVTRDIAFLEGLKVHLRQEPIPNRSKIKGKDGKEHDPTVLVIVEIKEFPWEADTGKKTRKGKAAGKKTKGKAKGKSNTANDVDIDGIAVAFVMGELSENNEGVSKASLPATLLRKQKAGELDIDPPTGNLVIQQIFSPVWMDADERPWVVENGVVQLPE